MRNTVDNYKNQREFVKNRLQESIAFVHELNAKLERRATVIVASSSAVVAIATGAEILPQKTSGGGIGAVALCLLLFCTVAMYFCVTKVWMTSAKVVAGTTDVKKLYHKFMSQEEVVAENNAIIDLAASLEKMADVNLEKGEGVDQMVMIVRVQLLIVAAAVAWSAFGAFGK